jgi:hypothetical protein
MVDRHFHRLVFQHRSMASWNPNVAWVKILTADFTGDGRADLTSRYQQGGQWWSATLLRLRLRHRVWSINLDDLSDLENSMIGTKTMAQTRPIVASTSGCRKKR